MDNATKRSNLRLGLMLAALAATFFVGFIAKFFLAR
jgi:hypothetical protein